MCHRVQCILFLGGRPKSAGAEKSELLKQVQALFNLKYGTFVIYTIDSTLNHKSVCRSSLYYIFCALTVTSNSTVYLKA